VKGEKMESVLKIERLSKSFGRKKIIDDISFEVRAGEVFGFLGPNGAGKTTTLKMVMGFLSVDSGTISIAGKRIDEDYELAMEQLGGIVENPELYQDLTGKTNLEMYARLHKGVDKARIQEAAALVGMQGRMNEKVKKYSLGMKQRIGLAQSLLHKPRLLILDEPTNGLDPAGIRELRDILKRLAHEENTAVVVSSHLLSEMQLMCDRVAIIHQGRLLDVKPVSELTGLSQPAATYRFITSQIDEATKILEPVYGEQIKNIAQDNIELLLETDKVPAVIRLLAMQGINLYGVNRQDSSLEDAFLQVTGGGLNIE
jgi:ABC-2 type transport system ATP-binding protein